MKNTSEIIEYCAAVSEQLNEDDFSLIDFDKLRECLRQFSAESSSAAEITEEHALLRSDLQHRIAGMIKAIAAVDRKRDSYESALSIIEELPSLTAEELLRRYRSVSARFRDRFPASFSGYRTGRTNSLNLSQMRDLR